MEPPARLPYDRARDMRNRKQDELDEAIAAAGDGAVPPEVAAALRRAVASGGSASVGWEAADWRGDVERLSASAAVVSNTDASAALAAAGFTAPPGTRGARWVWSGPTRPAAANDGPVRVDLTEDGGVVLRVVGCSDVPVEIIFSGPRADRVSRQLAGAAREAGQRVGRRPLDPTGSG